MELGDAQKESIDKGSEPTPLKGTKNSSIFYNIILPPFLDIGCIVFCGKVHIIRCIPLVDTFTPP